MTAVARVDSCYFFSVFCFCVDLQKRRKSDQGTEYLGRQVRLVCPIWSCYGLHAHPVTCKTSKRTIHITYTMRAETHNGHINCAFHLTCHAHVTFKCCRIAHTPFPRTIYRSQDSPSAGHDSFCMSDSISLARKLTAPMANIVRPKGRKPKPKPLSVGF